MEREFETAQNRPFREMVEERLQNHPDLLEKRKDQLGDPMMQTALWAVMNVRDSKARIAEAKPLVIVKNGKELQILRDAKQITDWFDPWDDRLEGVTGDSKPNRGGRLFGDQWININQEFNQLIAEVAHIMMPSGFEPTGTIGPNPTDDGDILFTHFDDFAQCFPTTANTLVAEQPDRRAWAAIALCDNDIGFAMFALQILTEGEQSVRLTIEPLEQNMATELRQTCR